MNKLTADEINTGIQKIESLYLLEILDTLLQRFHYDQIHIIESDVDGIKWETHCLNPFGELYPEEIL